MFSTVLGLAAIAGSIVSAAPVAIERDQPSTYYTPYLEPYDQYHLRYLALDCQDKHDTSFFDECCHPLVIGVGQTLADRPSYCTPNATEIASASSFIASTSEYGAPTPTGDAGAGSPSTPTSTSSVDDGSSEYCEAESSTTSTSLAQTSSAAAEASSTSSASSTLTTQAALAPATTTSSTHHAAATTSQASSNNNNGGSQSGNAETGGYATFFYQNGNPGACGNYHDDSYPLVAIDKAWYPNFGVVSQYCGQWVTIQNTQNGKTVVAQIQDVCPTCANGNSLDLSVGAFTAIASESEGMVPITWWFNN